MNLDNDFWVKDPRYNGKIDTSKITAGTITANPDALTLGNVMFGPGSINGLSYSPSFGPTIGPVPNSPSVSITPEIQKQITDMYKNVPDVKSHSHYFKDVSKLKTIDVYRVLELFGVTDQALGHAIKKLLVAGGRGAGKSIEKDIQEAVDTLLRRLEMKRELPND